ncbi:PREDICTED: ribonucleases P/MRP protein subunit POP1 [Nicrophorus vespilloides]|uniref:Ribonucleases P/MRP protein subunit POP1 n=1 Tax=Nicrophorus vespilloides TaxID=110193 RepID=A0ABM1MGV7_NICVS|nr:PREDICTED: ribonucleases P/MRP protein subunit POP1 [Nicrophorus vespilloides]XP_017773800.1 PREDICTED: ribonucleases P/MRP protein subunit POP1 [Nicrophorus vespilloides]XP_017773807.1 PREDICTED: ribonucleases P/MRP protein subunit POP1 [Nicrophorus vespilloides]
MHKESQYDNTLGGSQELPNFLQLMKFSAARSLEIQSIKESLKTNKGCKLAFQKLPKHMRRRVMAHDVKRLPRRVREIHMNQMIKSGMPPKLKRPSRKYRRRPKNLMEEYLRRQRQNMWLETHIWHAKRFHMVNKWGYRLPDRPCDKSFRACYRATAKHCLIQDISYMSCIELQGSKETLINYLRNITSRDEKLSIGARVYISGKREGDITLFTNSSSKPIGKISFNWKINNITKIDTLWLWIHAAYYQEALDTIIDLFNLKKKDNILYNDLLKVELRELRHELTRIRLTGPLSQAILEKSLQPINSANHSSEWFKEYLEDAECRQLFAEQVRFWQNVKDLNSPSLLSPRIITSLVVRDPRYLYPNKRTKAITKFSKTNLNIDLPANLNVGPIWDSEIRAEVKSSKISNAEITELQSLLLVPGSEIERPPAPIPVMLIQKQGVTNYGSGWDVVIPSGWAQPFWLGFLMWGGRAGGLRETEQINFEFGRADYLEPDSAAGKLYETELAELHTKKFFRLPPNKRCNYNKFSIASPFSCNWEIICRDWGFETQGFSVLRDHTILQALQESLQFGHTKNVLLKDIFNKNYLIPVKVTVRKGIFPRYSIICMPTKEDIKHKKEPIEKSRKDENEEKRKRLRRSHRTLLMKLKRKRHLARQTGKKIEIDMEVLKNYQKQMRELWLPTVDNGIRTTCDREIMGFVTKGQFSYFCGKSVAIGYIAIGAFHSMTLLGINRVLIRNTKSRQYRFGTMEIII